MYCRTRYLFSSTDTLIKIPSRISEVCVERVSFSMLSRKDSGFSRKRSREERTKVMVELWILTNNVASDMFWVLWI